MESGRARETTDRLVFPPVCFRPFDRARVSLRVLEMVQPICKAIFFSFGFVSFKHDRGVYQRFVSALRLSMIDEPLLLVRKHVSL